MKRLPLLLFVALFVSGALFFHQHAPTILDTVRHMGAFAPVLFICLYIAATVFFLPTLMLTFASGALFGVFLGTIYNLIGATIGAIIAFCISRYWIRKNMSAKKDGQFSKILQGIDKHGWIFLAVVRAFPIIPFNLVNYGMGLTHMSLLHYTLITAVFLAPTELFYTWCGYTGGKALTTEHIIGPEAYLLVLGVLVALFIFPYIKRLSLKLINKRLK